MISAKNYVAQAIRCVSENMIPDFIKRGYDRDVDDLKQICNHLEYAVHFAIPDNGKLLNDGLRGLRNKSIRLPFKNISIEYFSKLEPNKKLILASEVIDPETGDFLIASELMYFYCGEWCVHPIICFIDANAWDRHEPNAKVVGVPKDDFPGVKTKTRISLNDWCRDGGLVRFGGDEESAAKSAFTSVPVILELCEALSCRNVSTTNHQDSSPSNSKRIKAGKLPFYETKMLVIDSQVSSGKRSDHVAVGSHSSPRQHLRRGHIRRLESGNIWVQSCVVGDPTKGSINKQYSVI